MSDLERLAKFYKEILGFEELESLKFGEFRVIWLRLSPVFALHLIERNPETKLLEGPWSSTAAIANPKNLPRGHHICFAVLNYDSFIQTLNSPFHGVKGKH
ncbi:hypothetical protein NE237_031681 [Protea cynaroides]|uniref:Lactoylglutathione lyase n=1 Tax=Protea cynaroides TaxID=273540 RepID=A0A9Q0L2R7_9MAGN|nr:hypothetical protein NE237_031681 [Protea cynaroides]